METSTAHAPAVAAQLTHVALRLLDVTFEPASVSSGERFDRVVEALSDHLNDTATSLLAGVEPRAFTAPSLPPLPSATTRRAQAELRHAVDAGHLPGSARSVRSCVADLARARDDLDAIVLAAPEEARDALTPCAAALRRLTHVVEVYAQGYGRVSATLASAGCSRELAADSATRGERALLRCLDRCGDTRPLR